MAVVDADPWRAGALGPLPAFVAGGPDNPMGARGMYLFSGNKDTLYRIHGTNQPEYIGQAISSGCIRMTNEDAIDLYSQVKVGTMVVVLAPIRVTTPSDPHMAAETTSSQSIPTRDSVVFRLKCRGVADGAG